MNIPKGFTQKTKKEIEEIVRKTLVKEVLVEELAEKIEVYLEGKEIAKTMQIDFEGWKDLSKDKYIKTQVKRRITGIFKPKEAYEYIRADMEEQSPSEAELEQILYGIKEIEPSIKEEEISINSEYSGHCLSISSKKLIYKLSLYFNKDSYTEIGGTGRKREEKDGGTITTKGVSVPLTRVYYHPRLYGNMFYIKFNQEHHEKLLKVLTNKGYKWEIKPK